MSTNINPSAPRLELLEHHYGSETGCDVVFLVGPSQDNCLRIPAHSHILKEATPVFAAMFSNNFFTSQHDQERGLADGVETEEHLQPNQQNLIPHQIPISDLDGKAFDNLMKYLYDNQLLLQSPETTIETLKAAHKYQCAGLVRKCVNHLIGLISVDNVLLIAANVAMLGGDFQNLENLCRECTGKEGDCVTFPQLIRRRLSEANSELNIELDCAWLVYNCLNFIDRNAVTTLQSDEIEDLDFFTIQHILSRDTLDANENLVFSALVRWADKECKRRHLPLTSESKREVLQDLVYLPRYLQMSSSDFLSGPAASGFLSSEEVETLTHLIQIGPAAITSSSPDSSPYKRIQTLGIPASKSLRIHLAYLLRPRKKPVDQKNQANVQGSDGNGTSDGNWKWIARLKKMRCCVSCCESRSSSRCTSPSILSSPLRQSSEPRLSISSTGVRRNHKVGFVERAVVIFACLFD